MPDSASHSAHWIRAKGLSLKRKATTPRKESKISIGDSFLIVTEGKVTEPVYFELLLQKIQLSTVKIKIIPGKTSDPIRVIQTAVTEAKKLTSRAKRKKIANNELEKYDHVWAVVDTDHSLNNGKWNEITQKAHSLKVNLAHSTPCFEFWLLLHLSYTTRSLTDGIEAKKTLKKQLGSDYSTNREQAKKAIRNILPYCATALKHADEARKHHHSAKTKAPANPIYRS